jgi:transposase-like protein
MDPRDFDDQGTPRAWMACDACLVRRECRADCFRERPFGVYRAGRRWPELGKSDDVAEECVDCTRPMIRSVKGRLRKGWVRHQANGRCENCDRRWRRNSTTVAHPFPRRLEELHDLLARGLDLNQAADAMGMKRNTLRDYLTRARRPA